MFLNEALKNGNITTEEAESFMKHFEDPKFRELFEEYAKEISDPKAKAEHDAYLAQIEAEGQAEAIYGKGVQLIVPEPGLVIKTKDITGKTRVYINVCTSSKVERFSRERSTDDSQSGLQLLLPSALHSRNPKASTAPDGGAIHVWDWAVHPDTLQEAAQWPSFMNTMAIIAMERIEQAAGIKLMRHYKLPKLKYKAIEGHDRPAVMSVHSGGDSEVVDGKIRPKTNAQTAPLTSSSTSSGNSTAKQQKAVRSSFSFDADSKPPSVKQHELQASASPSSPGYTHDSGAVTPQWELVERGSVDLTQAWQDKGLAPATTTPQALVLRVQLPEVASAAAVQLDVSSDRLQLEVPGRYMLQLQLKYLVKDQQGTAKFDKAKQQLTITLPVAQPDTAPHTCAQQQQLVTPLVDDTWHQVQSPLQQEEQQTQQQQQQQSDGEEPAARQASAAESPDSNDLAVSSNTPQGATAELQPREQQRLEADAAAMVTVVTSDKQAAKTANQLQWEHLHTKLDSEQSQQNQQNQQAVHASQQDQQAHPQHISAQQQQQAAAGVTAAPPPQNLLGVLKPRLQGRKVTASMLD